ncbi:MAG: hypothetical protein ABIC04_00915 [Nanoarchaeota archaeon]
MVERAEWKDMVEPKTFIRYKGVWDMQDLYEAMIDWFRRNKYYFKEAVYKHKHPSPFGAERQHVWEAKRNETDYIQIKYHVYIHIYDARDVEVQMPEGDKKIYTKGRIWIEVKVSVISDFEGRWNKKMFYAHLKDFYNKYVIRKNFTEGWGPKHRYEMYNFVAMIKQRLKMESDEYEHRYFTGVHKVF